MSLTDDVINLRCKVCSLCLVHLAQDQRLVIQCAIGSQDTVEMVNFMLQQFRCGLIEPEPLVRITVLIGEVRGASYREGKPLVFFDSGYKKLE